jgi:hypothetical protein
MSSLGFADKTSAQLLEICPDEGKNRLKAVCGDLEKSIGRIKKLNADTLEVIEKKLEVAEEYMRRNSKQHHPGLTGPGFYGATGGKVRVGDPENEIIGKM